MKIKDAKEIAGSLGEPSKMPCFSYGLPAQRCITGSKLHNVDNTVCHDCYALKGNYIFVDVKEAQAKRLSGITNPLWIDAMVTMIAKKLDDYKKSRVFKNYLYYSTEKYTKRDGRYFRWHDSGDLQSVEHLEAICEIARRCSEVNFWLPTREYGILREHKARGYSLPSNLVIRISAHIVDGPLPTKLAEQIGAVVSGVHTNESGRHGMLCEAYKRNNFCGDCRACWQSGVNAVSYLKH